MLFKYVSEPSYIMQDGYIRAAQLSALNDPFEANYSKAGLKKLSRELGDILDNDGLIDYIEKEKYKVGVISFSESKDDLLMWAHYANEHKGALIGFLNGYATPNVFIADAILSLDKHNCFIGKCLPVSYRKQPLYKIDPFDRDYSNFLWSRNRILFEIFQQKSNEWIYEKEHRVTLKLEQADRVVIDDVKDYESCPWFKNIFVERNMIEGDFFTFDGDKLFVFLENIASDIVRCVCAQILSELAKDNPKILYLFNLSNLGMDICSIAYGCKADKKSIKNYSNISMITRFEKFRADNANNYTLRFVEIR